MGENTAKDGPLGGKFWYKRHFFPDIDQHEPDPVSRINKKLTLAVAYIDPTAVMDFLEQGGDPNYVREGDEPEETEYQPTTPLKLVMFRISDCMLEDSDLDDYAQIAKMLLMAGADPRPAIKLAEIRYGCYDEHRRPEDDRDAKFQHVRSIVQGFGVNLE